ncbi:hypothetical protein CHR29_14800 [Pseudomonas monteilii]|nr:hypothetical protein CHR29_14800 [Pseudomonas monteilii]AYN99983.1 hypothetical protein D8767_13835 [Pseudomonas sp. LTGT-11-2Z]
MGTAPHLAGRFSSRVNRFSCEHAPAAEKTPVWLNVAPRACRQVTLGFKDCYAKTASRVID